MKRMLSSVALFAALALAGCAGPRTSQAPADRSAPSPTPAATRTAPVVPLPSPTPAAPAAASVPASVPAQTAPALPAAPSATPKATRTAPAVVPAPAPAPTETVEAPPYEDCGSDSYVNVDGVCVPRPVTSSTVPAGATARCVDGTWSFSQHRQGTCSHHGGVAEWL